MLRRLALLVLPLAACEAADTATEPAALPVLDAKADAADRVVLRAALDLGAPVTGAFTRDLEFHGYPLSVAPGAVVTLEVTQKGSSRALDSTLFVFGPKGSDGFPDAALAFDDDAGWGRLSRLRDLPLKAGGEYLVVVGTHDARGRGNYRLQATCTHGGCAPEPPDACPAPIATGIGECLGVQIADGLDAVDALGICTDAEALGPVRDAACGEDTTGLCGLDFEGFYHAVAGPCRDALAGPLCGGALKAALGGAVTGLYYPSESDYPLEPFVVASLDDLGLGAAVEQRDFDALFRRLTLEGEQDPELYGEEGVAAAQQFEAVRDLLKASLTDLRVLRTGEIEITVIIIGRTACGALAGYRTISIET